jgi:hypothetical protein
VEINHWYKEYRKISKNFNPTENYQAIYHLDELGNLLKKEKKMLENTGKVFDEVFKEAAKQLYESIKSIKEYMNGYLWKDFIQLQDKYDSWAGKFDSYRG